MLNVSFVSLSAWIVIPEAVLIGWSFSASWFMSVSLMRPENSKRQLKAVFKHSNKIRLLPCEYTHRYT